MNEHIEIIVNGFRESVPKNASVSTLILYFKESDNDLIVEHNGRFVYPQKYSDIFLTEGDRIEFINPNFGG